jgi:hypothetical protein
MSCFLRMFFNLRDVPNKVSWVIFRFGGIFFGLKMCCSISKDDNKGKLGRQQKQWEDGQT